MQKIIVKLSYTGYKIDTDTKSTALSRPIWAQRDGYEVFIQNAFGMPMHSARKTSLSKAIDKHIESQL